MTKAIDKEYLIKKDTRIPGLMSLRLVKTMKDSKLWEKMQERNSLSKKFQDTFEKWSENMTIRKILKIKRDQSCNKKKENEVGRDFSG